jgi:hypothetical protein
MVWFAMRGDSVGCFGLKVFCSLRYKPLRLRRGKDVSQPEVQKLLGNGQEKIVRGKALQTLNTGSCLNRCCYRQPEGRGKSQPIHGRCATCGYEINWALLPGYDSISRR